MLLIHWVRSHPCLCSLDVSLPPYPNLNCSKEDQVWDKISLSPRGLTGHKYLSQYVVELRGVETETTTASLAMGAKVITVPSVQQEETSGISWWLLGRVCSKWRRKVNNILLLWLPLLGVSIDIDAFHTCLMNVQALMIKRSHVERMLVPLGPLNPHDPFELQVSMNNDFTTKSHWAWFTNLKPSGLHWSAVAFNLSKS